MFTYLERSKICDNPTAKKLFEIMEKKKTNLSIAADVTTKTELIKIAEELGPYICVLKTHVDIIEDYDNDLVIHLQRLAEENNFLLFEDRKFADIGNTVMHQYQDGIYHIADWSNIVNAHILPGPGIIEGLKRPGMRKNRGLLLLAQMSSSGNLLDKNYTQKAVEIAKRHDDFVIGFISMEKIVEDPKFIHFTPGVKIIGGGDAMGQQYNTPENVIKEKLSDIIIVGRGIYEADDPIAEAKKYQEAGWKAYLER